MRKMNCVGLGSAEVSGEKVRKLGIKDLEGEVAGFQAAILDPFGY